MRAARRFHVELLTVTVPDPDKKGNRDVTFEQSGIDNSVPLDATQFEKFQPVLHALKDAGVNIAV